MLSDQSAVLTSSHAFNRVNWEDPHYNVGLPVFAIHGNHDDPVREGDHVRVTAEQLRAVRQWPCGFSTTTRTHHVMPVPATCALPPHPPHPVAPQVLAPLDVLSAANLVNYIGKADTLTHVTLAPLLLRKGKTKVRVWRAERSGAGEALRRC